MCFERIPWHTDGNIAKKKKKTHKLFSTGLNYTWEGTIIATVGVKNVELWNLKSLLVYFFQIKRVKCQHGQLTLTFIRELLSYRRAFKTLLTCGRSSHMWVLS